MSQTVNSHFWININRQTHQENKPQWKIKFASAIKYKNIKSMTSSALLYKFWAL